MFKKKIGFAALAVGAALALVPTTASARDRDDYRNNYRGDERRERREYREHESREHERGRGLSFGFSYGAPVRRYAAPPAANGYYDQYGNWHAYGPSGYYDNNEYRRQ